MKKTIVIILGILSFISCKENNQDNVNQGAHSETQGIVTKFPAHVDSCKDSKYLFDALPHLDHVADCNFVSVQCAVNMILAEYKHKTENYNFQVIIYQEEDAHKIMYNTAVSLYEITSKQEVNGNKISDLKTFENATMTIKKTKDYYNIAYYATYKENFSIGISIQSETISNKNQTDDFLAEYLAAFNKEALK